MKVPSSVLKVLTNKYVLYFVLFLAVTNVLGYIVMGQFTATLFFIVIAYLISNFSRNMIIVLGAALLLTNILMVGNTVKEGFKKGKGGREGLENASASEGASASADKDKEKEKKQGIVTPSYDDKSSTDNVAMHTGSAAATHSDSEKDDDVTDEPKPQAKSDEGMNVKSNKKRNRIDYASTIEDAYGDLNKILGGEGIKRLTDDTQRLMTQQLQLADAMKSMTPLMENAKSMLQGFDLKSFDGLADMAKNFTATA
jgi:hypothetical protein